MINDMSMFYPVAPYFNNYLLTLVLTIDLLRLRSKDYYWLFLNKQNLLTTGPMKWDYNFAPMALPWYHMFNRVKVICKEHQLREFYFKLLHHVVTTKKELTLYGITDNNTHHYLALCTYCRPTIYDE